MSETCAVCHKGKGPEKCEVCGFSDNGVINRTFPIPEDTQNWLDTVVKPYRAQWEVRKREELAQLEESRRKESDRIKNIHTEDENSYTDRSTRQQQAVADSRIGGGIGGGLFGGLCGGLTVGFIGVIIGAIIGVIIGIIIGGISADSQDKSAGGAFGGMCGGIGGGLSVWLINKISGGIINASNGNIDFFEIICIGGSLGFFGGFISQHIYKFRRLSKFIKGVVYVCIAVFLFFVIFVVIKLSSTTVESGKTKTIEKTLNQNANNLLLDIKEDVTKLNEEKTSISTMKPIQDKFEFTDSRDGKKYKAVKIGNQIWMAENLNYNSSGSRCYGEGGRTVIMQPYKSFTLSNKEIKVNCEKYGRLYNWNSALKACPSGWHLPSEAEWNVLLKTVGGEKLAGKELRAKNGWKRNGNGIDTYGFSALPGGYGFSDGTSLRVGDDGRWWGSTEINAKEAYALGMFYQDEDAHKDYDGNKTYLHSVRCLQN